MVSLFWMGVQCGRLWGSIHSRGCYDCELDPHAQPTIHAYMI